MPRMRWLAGLILLTIPATLSAQEAAPTSKAEFDAAVRAYILDNPEVIIEAVQRYQQRQEASREAEAEAFVARNLDSVQNDGISPSVGPADATVTVVEFYDYQCGYCRRAYSDVKKLIAEEPDIRYVFKQFPILDQPGSPKHSDLAARVAIAVSEAGGDFLKYHDALMSREGAISSAKIYAAAQAAGLDRDEAKDLIERGTLKRSIANNIEIARSAGISGTPTYIVNGKFLRGARGFDALKAAVSAARTG